jgi:hypothetical protein
MLRESFLGHRKDLLFYTRPCRKPRLSAAIAVSWFNALPTGNRWLSSNSIRTRFPISTAYLLDLTC